jgi:hypothetical protein
MTRPDIVNVGDRGPTRADCTPSNLIVSSPSLGRGRAGSNGTGSRAKRGESLNRDSKEGRDHVDHPVDRCSGAAADRRRLRPQSSSSLTTRSHLTGDAAPALGEAGALELSRNNRGRSASGWRVTGFVDDLKDEPDTVADQTQTASRRWSFRQAVCCGAPIVLLGATAIQFLRGRAVVFG